MKRTEVCITIDTEFEINGALRWPDRREPIGPESLNRTCGKRSHGLGFILDTLERYGLHGTFFIEVMNVHYFGDGPMATIAAEIRARGHDLQLHIHPCWRSLPGRKAGTIPDDGYSDSFPDYSGSALTALLQEGRDIYTRLTGHPPLAFRSGGLMANRELFSALATTGFRMSSTLAIGVFEPSDPELWVTNGRCRITGVTELPVLAYRSPGVPGLPRRKAATLVGSAWCELKETLDQAVRHDAGPIVILTHAHEFSPNAGTPVAHRYVPAPRVQRRFDSLCRYLHEHDDRFQAVTFSERYADWISTPLPKNDPPPLQSSLIGLGIRLIENNLLPLVGVR